VFGGNDVFVTVTQVTTSPSTATNGWAVNLSNSQPGFTFSAQNLAAGAPQPVVQVIDYDATSPTFQIYTSASIYVNLQHGNVTATGALTGSNINPNAFGLTYANPLSVDITKGDVFTVTTTSGVGNATFNASAVGVAGRIITFEIANDAGATRTITFGTHFRPASTLVGTQSKTASISFRSDGVNWVEMCRVTGIT
jgi:hypothetical protein